MFVTQQKLHITEEFDHIMISDTAIRADKYFFLTQMLSSKDVNFMGYTYKNFEIVNDHEVPGMGNKSYIFLALSKSTICISASFS